MGNDIRPLKLCNAVYSLKYLNFNEYTALYNFENFDNK